MQPFYANAALMLMLYSEGKEITKVHPRLFASSSKVYVSLRLRLLLDISTLPLLLEPLVRLQRGV